MISGDEQIYFAMVELVRADDDCVLEPDLAGAFTHVAARAEDETAFLATVAMAAAELGLSLHNVEWVSSANGLSRVQINSDYYHALLPQLEDQSVGWAEFQCYPQDETGEEDEADAEDAAPIR